LQQAIGGQPAPNNNQPASDKSDGSGRQIHEPLHGAADTAEASAGSEGESKQARSFNFGFAGSLMRGMEEMGQVCIEHMGRGVH